MNQSVVVYSSDINVRLRNNSRDLVFVVNCLTFYHVIAIHSS